MSSEQYAEVAIVGQNLSAYLGTLQYEVPKEWAGDVFLGSAVTVSLRGGPTRGYVTGFASKPRVARVLPIAGLLPDLPKLTDHQLRLAAWICRRYLAPFGDCLKLFLPPEVGRSSLVETILEPLPASLPGKNRLGPRQLAVLAALDKEGPMTLAAARSLTGITGRSLKVLEDLGLLRRNTRDMALATAGQLTPAGYSQSRLTLTLEQSAAVEAIDVALLSGGGGRFLLDGETGSGKTEVYLRAIETSLKAGKGAIVVVPEISLTPQLTGYFTAALGPTVTVVHSSMTPKERHVAWYRAKSGSATVIVGARSALFSPIGDLGLVVIDEEHESSFKQDSPPRYVARDVALSLAESTGAVLVMGSATPSLEAIQLVNLGKVERLFMPNRVVRSPAPEIAVVDMRAEFKKGNRSIFSSNLIDALDSAAAQGEQAILFINRRGYSSFWLCRDCGHVPGCPNCQVSLSYHDDTRSLVCHHCGHRQESVPLCPACGSNAFRPFGTGTQKVVAELERVRPALPVIRMDRDSTSSRGSHARILESFSATPGAVLVGTQMVAKGLHIPTVSVVGVINADTAMGLPDFRSGERTFQLLKQVAGRAGRGDKRGKVIIQTYSPEHYALKAIAGGDSAGFYETEIAQRRELGFPPFVDLVNIIVSSPDDKLAAGQAAELGRILRSMDGVIEIFGPMPAPISRISGRFRYHVVIKTHASDSALATLAQLLGNMKISGKLRVTVDVDPQSML